MVTSLWSGIIQHEDRGDGRVSDEYEWAIGLQASFEPLHPKEETPERIVGKIIEVRDDSPWADEEHCRIVLECADGVYDVAKERVKLE